MTDEEHKLVMTIWASHVRALKNVVDILESRGVLEEEDARAIEFAATKEVPLDGEIAASYAVLLGQLGMKVPGFLELAEEA